MNAAWRTYARRARLLPRPAGFSDARLPHGPRLFHTDGSVRATGTAQDLVRTLLDKLACVQYLEYGTMPGPAPERERSGLKLTGTDILVSDLA